MTVTLTINGKRVTASDGSTILEAARNAGIAIPTLCHHPDLTDVGACRMCVVSVEKARGLLTACTTPVVEGMVVHTESEEARQTRKFVLEMLLTDHPNDCMRCEVNGDCELQDLVYDYGIAWPKHNGLRHTYPVDPDPNPFVLIDLNKCILCGRCVRACNERQNRDVWNFAHRGFRTKLVAGADQPMLDAGCESCGQCVSYCPVGALYDKMSVGKGRPSQIRKVRTTCSYCGVGCNFDLNVRDGQVVRVTANRAAPVNGMAMCVKGHHGYDYIHHPDRLRAPLVRARWLDDVEEKIRSGEWQVFAGGGNGDGRIPGGEDITPETFIQTDWDTALDVVARKFVDEKRAHSSRTFGMLTSSKCTNEDNYLVNKLTRQVLGTNTIDHCARI